MGSNIKKYKLSSFSIQLSLIGCVFAPVLLAYLIFFIKEIIVQKTINFAEYNSNIFIVAVLMASPGLYIFIEHIFFTNKNILVDIEKETITFKRKNKTYTNKFANVQECIIYKETESLYFLSSSPFSVCYITFKDGVEEKISCLAEWDLHRLLGRINYTEHRTAFPSILLYDFIRSLN